jgi:hypothetical protein
MENPSAHRKLVNLLALSLLAAGTLVGFAASGAASPNQQSPAAFQSYDQVVESFDQIVPGMTQAQDLPGLGFDIGAGALLSYSDITARFLADGTRKKPMLPAVRACLKAKEYCNAYVFRAGDAAGKPGLFGLNGARPWSAEVTLLVMNGRVTHKVLS